MFIIPTWSRNQDSTKNDFSSNLMAIISFLTTNLAFLVTSSNSKTIALLGPGHSSWRILKRTSATPIKCKYLIVVH